MDVIFFPIFWTVRYGTGYRVSRKSMDWLYIWRKQVTVRILIRIGRLWMRIRIRPDSDPLHWFCWLLVVGVLPGMVHVRNLLPLVCQEAVPLARLNKESSVKCQPIGSHSASFPPMGFSNKTIEPIGFNFASVLSIGFNNITIQPIGSHLASIPPIGFHNKTVQPIGTSWHLSQKSHQSDSIPKLFNQ